MKHKGKNNPNYKDGRKSTRLYRIYYNMKSRCYNTNVPSYKSYGARGITICEEWLTSFTAFKEWSFLNGYSDSLSLDRIDVNGNYEPDNCRWVTTKEQGLNTSRNHFVEINGETKPLDEWSRLYKMNPRTVRDRLKRGWDYVTALETPADLRYVK